MNEESLEHLWQKYLITRSPEDLRNYNLLRRESGLELHRETDFLDRWADNLFAILKNYEPCENFYRYREISRLRTILANLTNFAGDGRLNIINGTGDADSNTIAIKFKAAVFCCYAAYASLADGQRVLYINLSLPGSSNSIPATIYVTIKITENSITIKDSDTPWLVEKNNAFVDEKEILEFLLNAANQILIDKCQTTLAKVKADPTKSNTAVFLEYARHQRIKHIKKHPEVFNLVFKQDWFRELLYKYAEKVEKFCQKRDLIFDLEQIWPVTAIAKHGRAVLRIETGYNDTPVEDSDEDDLGENRGYAGEEADKLADLLNEFDEDHQMLSNQKWSGDYEIEEIDRVEGNVAFDISAEKTITTSYLHKFITEVSKF